MYLALCHLNLLLLFHIFGEYFLNCMPVELDVVCVKLSIPDGVDEEPYWAMILNVYEPKKAISWTKDAL